jgi:hypothetical protein
MELKITEYRDGHAVVTGPYSNPEEFQKLIMYAGLALFNPPTDGSNVKDISFSADFKALQTAVHVASVAAPVTSGGKTIGYKIK